MIRILYCGLLCFLLYTSPVLITAQSTTCPDTLPPQLIVGSQAQVTPGSSNNVRTDPTTAAERIGQITAGTVVNVLEGPICADGFAWWRVQTLDGALDGWTVEAVEGAYALVPYSAPTAAPIPDGWQTVDFEGVRFGYDPVVWADVSAEIMPPNLPENPNDQWQSAPQSLRFTVNSNTSAQADSYNRIEIFPAHAYARINPIFAEQLAALRDLLTNRPEPSTDAFADISFVRGAAQVFVARGQYIETEVFVGVRYLATYAQADYPVLRDAVRYVFAGITRDGQHVIIARLVLEVAPLPATIDDVSPDQWDFTTFQSMPGYLDALIEAINTMPPDAFTPRIETFDQVLATLNVRPDTLGDFAAQIATAPDNRTAVPTYAEDTCVNTDFSPRLRIGSGARSTLPTNNVIGAYVVPGGSDSGWGGVDSGEIVRVLDGPICHESAYFWLVYNGQWAGWVREAGVFYLDNQMRYFLEPVDIGDQVAVPVNNRQTMTTCRLILTSTSRAFGEPVSGANVSTRLASGTVYYADALLRQPDGGYLWWRLSPGALDANGAVLPDPMWVRAIDVSPSPECADVPVIDAP